MSNENGAWAAAFPSVGKLFSFLCSQKLTNLIISETSTFLPGSATIGQWVLKLLDNHAHKHTRAHAAIIRAVLPYGARLKTPTAKL